MKELKTFHTIVTKAKGNVIEGVFCVHGNVDQGGDRSNPGAFKNVNPARVRFLWNHQFDSAPVAVVKDIREIGGSALPPAVRDVAPEATGGVVVVREYLKTARGQEIKEGILSGAIREMSYGFNATRTQFTEVNGERVRELLEVDLMEVSDVLWGMNPATLAAKAGYRYVGPRGGDARLAFCRAEISMIEAGF